MRGKLLKHFGYKSRYLLLNIKRWEKNAKKQKNINGDQIMTHRSNELWYAHIFYINMQKTELEQPG